MELSWSSCEGVGLSVGCRRLHSSTYTPSLGPLDLGLLLHPSIIVIYLTAVPRSLGWAVCPNTPFKICFQDNRVLAGYPQMQVLLYLFSEDMVNTLCIPAFEDTSIWTRSVFLPNVSTRGYVFTRDIPPRGSGNREAVSLLCLVSYTWHRVFEVHPHVLSVLNTYLSACARWPLFLVFANLAGGPALRT